MLNSRGQFKGKTGKKERAFLGGYSNEAESQQSCSSEPRTIRCGASPCLPAGRENQASSSPLARYARSVEGYCSAGARSKDICGVAVADVNGSTSIISLEFIEGVILRIPVGLS